MEFFVKGVDVFVKLLILIGAGLGGWGVVNLLEGYGNDNPGAKSQGMKQFMAGVGIVLVATLLIPELKGLFA
ncbi:Maff2 family mobile element protein [Lysinibacillus sp. NPDC096418]|uniref:Maff2 family mobile element protein n=1 Tax=Lysinibacillus sp. NPDC096418 TaxID=3364138 RepID=UPI0038038846